MGIMSTIDQGGHAIRVSIDCASDFAMAPLAISACKRLGISEVSGVILDLRGIELCADRLAPLAQALVEGLSSGWPIALLASPSLYGAACGIAVKAGAPRADIEVFRCPDDARDWLNCRQAKVDQAKLSSIPVNEERLQFSYEYMLAHPHAADFGRHESPE